MATVAFSPSVIAVRAASGPSSTIRAHSTTTISTSFLQKLSSSRLTLSAQRIRIGSRVPLIRATVEAEEAAPADVDAPPEFSETEVAVPKKKKKKKQVTAPTKRQLLTLKFLWLDKNIGIALDQVVPGQGVVPVSSYMFWPRKDAWEQLKNLLDEKPWVSKKRAIILLNQATDIINQWQQTSYKP